MIRLLVRFEAIGGGRWIILSQTLFTILRRGVLAFLFLEQIGVLEDGLTAACFGNTSILGGHSSKADSYQ